MPSQCKLTLINDIVPCMDFNAAWLDNFVGPLQKEDTKATIINTSKSYPHSKTFIPVCTTTTATAT